MGTGQTEVIWPKMTKKQRKKAHKMFEDNYNAKHDGANTPKQRGRTLPTSNGWNYDTSIRFNIVHLPDQNIIRLKIWEGSSLVIDSGDINDPSSNLQGGRLGVYCDSQPNILWSNLKYRCIQM